MDQVHEIVGFINAYCTEIQHIGIIARNKEGLVMASCAYPWENILDPTMAEARACLQAVAVIRKLISAVEDRSCIRSLIQEIKGRTSKFRSLQFKHVPREANKAAHG
ncbi:hypothetical protein Gotur_023316 [Gossypium turneri]